MAAQIWNSAHANIVFDGHSILQYGGENKRISDFLPTLSTINGALACKNVAIAGQTFAQMTSSIADLNTTYEAGKQNFLFVMEACNSAANSGLNAAQIIAACQTYIAAAKAANPGWRVYLIINTPMREDVTPTVINNAIDGFNAYIRSNYKQLGAEGYVETRPPGGPFDYQSYAGTFSNFQHTADAPYQGTGPYSDGVHLNERGTLIVAQYINTMLPSIPDAAPITRLTAHIGNRPLIIGGKLITASLAVVEG